MKVSKIAREFYPYFVFLGWVLSFLAFNRAVEAREFVYGKARETVPVPFGPETLFRFPMEVKTITEAGRFEIRPSNPEEPDYSVLVVKPRVSEGASDVTFILSDGSVIKTQLVISNRPNLKHDSIYDFKPRDELLETNPNLSSKRDPMVVSELDLLRAMIRGDRVSGFEEKQYSLSIPLETPNLSAQLVKTYVGKDVNGYVYRLKSESKSRSFKIDLKGIAIGQPNLAVLAQVDRDTVGGSDPVGSETYLRVVAKPGASSLRMTLPVSIRNEEKK